MLWKIIIAGRIFLCDFKYAGLNAIKDKGKKMCRAREAWDPKYGNCAGAGERFTGRERFARLDRIAAPFSLERNLPNCHETSFLVFASFFSPS